MCTCNEDISPNLNVIHPCVIYHPHYVLKLTKVVEHGTHQPKWFDYRLCKFPSQHFNYNSIVDHGYAKNIP
jgi:hypothetical protein